MSRSEIVRRLKAKEVVETSTDPEPSKLRLPRIAVQRARMPRLSPMERVFHPAWNSADDHRLLRLKSRGKNFTYIAASLGRTRISVEQRWHRLRVVRGISNALVGYGLSKTPYNIEGCNG
ncbi:hypothetical protein RKLH11_1842 [Rhodobacteraceae bacterium KLH11]|nr:hypothetical protein RKLH11_1842 [Rhodobacteraceae bacterium KLH11]